MKIAIINKAQRIRMPGSVCFWANYTFHKPDPKAHQTTDFSRIFYEMEQKTNVFPSPDLLLLWLCHRPPDLAMARPPHLCAFPFSFFFSLAFFSLVIKEKCEQCAGIGTQLKAEILLLCRLESKGGCREGLEGRYTRK